MRYVKADLLDDVVSSYDQTKTTIQGRCYEKTVDGKVALGPPINKFVDVFTDSSGQTIVANNAFLTTNGRIFILGPESGAATPLMLYTINYDTGATVYVGRVNIILPDVAATTTTYRSIKAIDTGTTGWKLFITTTGSVTINGGTMLVNNLALSDFVPIGFPNIPFATGNDQKAVYFCQDPANLGSLHANSNIASAGSCLDAANNRLYVHNGVAATHQYYVFNTSATPTWTSYAITGTEATNLINHAGHPFVNGDQVTFTALTGGAGLSTAVTAYFVVNSVAGVSYQLSATSGGAAINFTTDISAGTIGRAFGQTGDLFVHKTGNLPALTGTLLLTDSEDFAQPTATGIPAIDTFDCVFFGTNSNMYLGRLSDLTSGAVTWPSLATVNYLGTANQIVNPAATNVAWSNVLQCAVVSIGTVFIMKNFVNNQIRTIFGGTSNRYLEGLVGNEVVEFQPAANIVFMDLEQGWLAVSSATTGQRGLLLADLRSDAQFDYSYFVTKVMNTPQAVYKFITTIDALFDYTGALEVYYRTSGFGSLSGGWTAIPFAEDLTTFLVGEQVQFKVLFSTLGLDTSIPAQICDFFLGFDSQTDTSINWELSVDDSDNGNPSRTAFRLKEVYSGSVPTLYYRAYDLTNVLIVNHNTVTNAARFEYSSDSGVSWNAVGTIPNVVGTLVRYTFATPPGVDLRPSLKES
jgi:hypothetical protein